MAANANAMLEQKKAVAESATAFYERNIKR